MSVAKEFWPKEVEFDDFRFIASNLPIASILEWVMIGGRMTL
jgi:hypothetical protein